MPLNDFRCKNKKCGLVFEELCGYNERAKMKCPKCGKKTEVLPPMTKSTFTDPTTSSKWDSFTYRAGKNLEKAQAERRYAESKSHVGKTPYQDQERGVDVVAHDMAKYENRIV